MGTPSLPVMRGYAAQRASTWVSFVVRTLPGPETPRHLQNAATVLKRIDNVRQLIWIGAQVVELGSIIDRQVKLPAVL